MTGRLEHGEGNPATRLYRIWAAMKRRCFNPNSANYPWYGGKGISVCDEWRDSFVAFRDWSLANGYDADAPDLSIDRINSDNDYSPANCQWITMTANRHRPKRKLSI